MAHDERVRHAANASQAARPGESLLVVQTAWVGDIVLTTPLLRELRRARRQARITLLTTEAGRQLLEGAPWVDRFLTLDKRWGAGGIFRWGRLLAEIARSRFDVAVAAQRSVRSGIMVALSRAERRIGFAGAPGAWAYRDRVRRDPGTHAVRRYLELCRPLGGDPQQASGLPEVPVSPLALKRARRLLRAEGISGEAGLLAVAPGSARATKRWPVEGFAEVVRVGAARGLVPVIVGSASERELCESVAASSGVRGAVLAGRTGLAELAALLSRCVALVGNDSGAGHVASAVGTPTVTVFGPTAPDQGYAPAGKLARTVEHPGLDCRPCSPRGPATCPRGHFQCMLQLGATPVIEALEELLRRAGPERVRAAQAR